MIVRKEKGMDGKEVTLFTPENEADLELLRAMEERAQLDRRLSFGDEPAQQQEPEK